MSRFLKKRVPAFLMTLVMVTTLIPMASAKSSADIEYEVDAGDNVTLEFSDFQNYYDKYESDNLYRMEFTDLTDVDSNGRMYAVDFEGDEVRVNEDNLYNSWFYASKSDVQDSGKYRIKGMNYSAGSKADGETAELAFTLYGDKKGKLEGILRIYIGSSGSSKSGTISYSVKSGEEVAFDEDDFQKLYDKSSCTGTFKYLVFDRPSTSEYANGTIYSRYGKRNETSFSRSALNGNTFGYSDYADGDYNLSDLSFVADSSFTSGSITLSFTLYGGTGSRTNQSTTGTLKITSGKSSSTTSRGDITYTVKAGEEVAFDEDDFQKLYDKSSCTGTFKYLVFDRPSTSEYANGTIYSRYNTRKEVAFSRSDFRGTTFGYSDYADGDYDLSDLSFVADSSFTSGSITLSFTLYGGTGSRTNQSTTGTLVITSGKSSSTTSKGDITYTVKAGEEVAFDEDDFQKLYDKSSCTGTFKYLVFDRPSTSEYANGTIYSRYGKRNETSFSRSALNGNTFGYSDYADGDYDLSDLSFVADKAFTSGSITLSFTLYGGTGSRTNQSTTGTLKITSGKSSSTTSKGDITYTVKAGSEVSFDEDDFQKLYDKSSCTGTFKYLVFDRPSTSEYANGTIYSRYGKRNETSFSRSALNGNSFGYSDYADGDYDLSDLSFVADKSFSGSITLSFTLYGGTGSRTNQSTTGTLVITSGNSGSSRSYYVGNIRCSVTPGTALQINPNDIARYFKKCSGGGNLMYVTLTSLPTAGSLYYNYYGTSQYGVSSRTQMTAASAAGRMFAYSPSAKTEYALSELTYIPSGTNYCTAIGFTAYGGNGQSYTGSILISVSTQAVPEIYSVTTKGTSVSFPATAISSAVSGATGASLSSIQLLDLPATTSGVVYYGSSVANTTSQYAYANLSQLRFVPNSNFTGSVSIPYVALNSSGTAMAMGQFSIGVVSSVKKFRDVATTTWCYKYVTELSSANIISGYSNGSFQEKNTITYGAALKLIMLAAGYGEQAPTVKGSTFSGYLAKAKADGLVTGNPKLNGSITRLQIAQIASKALKLSTTNLSNKKPFTDTNDVYVQALNAAGIIEGYFSNGTSTYKPNSTLTRGQVSAIVWRMRNYEK